MNKDINKIVQDLIELQRKYSHIFRAITTEERYNNIVKSGILSEFTYDDDVLREPLIEHVGHLPIIASYLYPHIENGKEVNLGRSLVMLSIHDIGETVTGDILTFDKTEEDEEEEFEKAKEILEPVLFEYYEEYEDRKSYDAKYAKSIDSIAPLLHEMTIPDVTAERFEHYKFDLVKIDEVKRKHFEWDKVLMEIFENLMERYEREVKN